MTLKFKVRSFSRAYISSTTTHAKATNVFDSNVLWVRQFIPTTAKCVTLTDDLEVQGHINMHMTLPISASTHAI